MGLITENDQSDCGFAVLRYENGGVVGWVIDFTYRQMIDLKKDGTFGYLYGGRHGIRPPELHLMTAGEYIKICNVTQDFDTATLFCNGQKFLRKPVGRPWQSRIAKKKSSGWRIDQHLPAYAGKIEMIYQDRIQNTGSRGRRRESPVEQLLEETAWSYIAQYHPIELNMTVFRVSIQLKIPSAHNKRAEGIR